MSWRRYLLVLMILCHGFVYINAARGLLPGMFDGWNGSLLLGNTINLVSLVDLAKALWIAAGVGMIGSGITSTFIAKVRGLSRMLAIIASTVGIVGFAVFWDGQTQRIVGQGLIGAVLSFVILFTALVYPKAFSLGVKVA